MTSALMLSRLRTLLDEASASFWTDDECYRALSDGQREVVNIVFNNNPNSQLLKALLKTATGSDTTTSNITLPSDFKEFVTVTYSSTTTADQYPCRIIAYDKEFLDNEYNSYLSATIQTPVVYLRPFSTATGRKIFFSPSSAHCDYTIIYLTQPTEIDGSTNPIVPADMQEAIILYAFSFLLRKDMRPAEADGAYKLFLEMAGKL